LVNKQGRKGRGEEKKKEERRRLLFLNVYAKTVESLRRWNRNGM
jgi:hypothetical protein